MIFLLIIKKKKKSHVGCSEKVGDLEQGNEASQGISYLIEVLKKTHKCAACFLLFFLLSTIEMCFADSLEIFD